MSFFCISDLPRCVRVRVRVRVRGRGSAGVSLELLLHLRPARCVESLGVALARETSHLFRVRVKWSGEW